MLESTPYGQYLLSLQQKGTAKDFSSYKLRLRKNKVVARLFDAFPCAIAILDYQTQKYLYLSEGTKEIFGYCEEEIENLGGLSFYLSLIHPDDLSIVTQNSFKKTLASLGNLSDEQIKRCKISFNCRTRRKDGVWIKILQNTMILEMDEQKNPLLILNIINDISHFKDDNKVNFVVSRYDEGNGFISVISRQLKSESLLSNREMEITRFIASGMKSREIAEKLNISVFTVNAHRRKIMEKTNCGNVADLTGYAFANGLV